jgi:hypothetical protein
LPKIKLIDALFFTCFQYCSEIQMRHLSPNLTSSGWHGQSPSSLPGKLCALACALLGFPLLWVFLRVVGGAMATGLAKVYAVACCNSCARCKKTQPEGGQDKGKLW